jgi:hypothetical protein
MAAVLMDGEAKMRKYAIAAWLSGIILASWQGASGAEMSEPKGPSFAVGADTLLSGDEPEFVNCKAAQVRYLTQISAKAEAVVYAHSPEWGYVLRVLYTNISQPAEKGTLICWRSEHVDETNMMVDVEGTAADLGKSQ